MVHNFNHGRFLACMIGQACLWNMQSDQIPPAGRHLPRFLAGQPLKQLSCASWPPDRVPLPLLAADLTRCGLQHLSNCWSQWSLKGLPCSASHLVEPQATGQGSLRACFSAYTGNAASPAGDLHRSPVTPTHFRGVTQCWQVKQVCLW